MKTDKDCGIERDENNKLPISIIIVCCVIAAIFIAYSKGDEISALYHQITTERLDEHPISNKNPDTIIVNTIEIKSGKIPTLPSNENPNVISAKKLNPMAFMALVSDNRMSKVQEALQNYRCDEYKDRDDNEALAYISNKTSVEMIDFLIKNGCDINHKNKYDNTPIMFAVKSVNLDMIKVLIEKGADLSATTRSGRTVISLSTNNEITNYLKSISDANVPEYLTRVWWRETTLPEVQSIINTLKTSNKRAKILTLASANISDPKIIGYLIDNGFDIHEMDENGVSPIFAAATSNIHPEILRELSSRGANINARAKNGMTPMMFAVYFKNIRMVEALLDLGADLNIQDDKGLTAINYAHQTQSFALTKLLVEHSQNKNNQKGL